MSFVEKQKDKKIIHVEYVSANPTGPLHIGHGRGMMLGEITARFLSYQGHQIKENIMLMMLGDKSIFY